MIIIYIFDKNLPEIESKDKEKSRCFTTVVKVVKEKEKKCNKKVLKQRICQSSSCSQHTAAFFEFNSRNCLLDFSY